MEFTSGQYLQLIAALMLGVITFVGAYSISDKVFIAILIVAIPFQPVMSSFGSINMVLVYLVGAAFILRKRITRFPMWPWTVLILLAYLSSAALAPAYTRFDNLIYIISILSSVLFFYMMFNYVYSTGNLRSVVHFFIFGNVLVVVYCIVQLAVGLDHFALFGVQEFSFEQNRADGRLLGPFNAAGITAEYMVVQTFILIYQYMFDTNSKKVWRRLSFFLIPSNSGLLIMTGNRTAIIVLFLAGILFAYLFRRELGMKKIIIGSVGALITFVIVSVAIVNLSQFNVLFERFANTEVKDGVIDTRSKIWPHTWDRIMNKPILGHGPRIRLIDEDKRHFPAGYEFMPYPHSMYLFHWYTLGIVGLIAYLGFFFRLFLYYQQEIKNIAKDKFMSLCPILAIVLWFCFMLDQAKVSAFRFSLVDYQHYIFAVFGSFLGAALYLRKERKERKERMETLRKTLL